MSRAEAPGRFWRLIAGYAVMFGMCIAAFAWFAVHGGVAH